MLPNSAAVDPLLTGLPANIDAERLILGSILAYGDEVLSACSAMLAPEDFSLTKHVLIFRRILDLDARGVSVDRVTLANELMDRKELESVDGLSYLLQLDENMPRVPSLDSYCQIVRDKSKLRRIFLACQNISARCLSGDGGADEILEHGDKLLSDLGGPLGSSGGWSNPGDIINGFQGGLDALMTPSRGGAGVPLPWRTVQEQVCGLQAGDLVILAGRPSHGKSAAALQIARSAAESGIGVAYVSLEMSKAALLRRLVCSKARVNSHLARLGYLSAVQRRDIQEAANAIEGLPLWIEDEGAHTPAAIRQTLKRLRAKHPIGLVIVDHFHLVAGSGREDERQRYNRIADDFQRQAKEFGVPFVVLAQLSRKCEEERRAPGLSDLKETAKLEENADLVLFVYRPECYASNRTREELHGVAEFIIGKQRNGPTGKVPMVFLKEFQTFELCAGEDRE